MGKPVIVELKNDLCIRGLLHSVDQFLNVKLDDVQVVDADQHPHLVRKILWTFEFFLPDHKPVVQLSVKRIFIRGSVVRYIQLNKEHVDLQVLQDASRRAARPDTE